MTSSAEIKDMLRRTLDEFDLPTTTIASSARQALRIATLRQDSVNQLWLHWELTDRGTEEAPRGVDPVALKIQSTIYSLAGAEDGDKKISIAFRKWMSNRQYPGNKDGSLYVPSIAEIEHKYEILRNLYHETEIPVNLSPIDTYRAVEKLENSRSQIMLMLGEINTLLERVKSSIYEFLISTESELEYGQRDSSLFLRAQEYINTALKNFAPKALENFLAAQNSLYSGKPEDLSHALTSCRRMIKSLADSLYPATGEKIKDDSGKERVMSDDMYRNRLIQYVKESIGNHGQGEVLQDALNDLGKRLTTLDSLASKGVHADVSPSEAEACIVWTYLLAADIIRLADGSSSWISPNARATQDSDLIQAAKGT